MTSPQNLLDPREYANVYPNSNIILNSALECLQGTFSTAELSKLICTQLRQENDQLINVAINLAPNYQVAHLIWQSLNQAIHEPNLDQLNNDIIQHTHIFAIPIILVAGSKISVTLKENIDTVKLNDILIENKIFDPESGFVSGKLIDANSVAQVNPSQLYYWVRNIQQAKLWLPWVINGTKINVNGEGVFLRFLCGTIITNNHQNHVQPIYNDLYNKCSVAIMQLISQELKTNGVTLFPIPFTPINFNEAFVTGDYYRKEVAIQVSLSNIVRNIRQQRLTPIAHISTSTDTIHIVIKTLEPSKLTETSIWQLHKVDNFGKIYNSIIEILADMQVEQTYE